MKDSRVQYLQFYRAPNVHSTRADTFLSLHMTSFRSPTDTASAILLSSLRIEQPQPRSVRFNCLTINRCDLLEQNVNHIDAQNFNYFIWNVLSIMLPSFTLNYLTAHRSYSVSVLMLFFLRLLFWNTQQIIINARLQPFLELEPMPKMDIFEANG